LELFLFYGVILKKMVRLSIINTVYIFSTLLIEITLLIYLWLKYKEIHIHWFLFVVKSDSSFMNICCHHKRIVYTIIMSLLFCLNLTKYIAKPNI